MATITSTLTLVDNMSNKLAAISAAVNGLKEDLNGIGDSQGDLDKFSWDTFLQNAEAAGKQMEKIGNGMSLAVTGPLVLLGKKMYGNATDYESAFAGVKKTTDATDEEFNALYEDLLKISETNPTGFVEAAAIMEMAGQLGVAKEQLSGFTQTYIELQESTNIQGENGAADLARFLNVTEKTTANVDRVGGVIVGLGNNFATTEAEILSMATRMGATADLAGFTVPEILAFSAALSAVGINAEAGGSAAGKLMKRMQMAAEVGGSAQERLAAAGYQYASGLQFANDLASYSKGDLAGLASELGVTTDAVQEMASSWLALEQFSSVMGLDQAGFLKSWDEGAAQSMLLFFQGLGNMDAESGNSVLAQLAEMDLTEIRLSNLVAAMAGNGDLYREALEEANRQYNMDPSLNAMAVEVAKRYDTQESQNAMLANKLDNTTADFGQNLVDALNPVLEIVNDLLTKFNALSESDQSKIITTLGAVAALGPALTVTGRAVEAIAKIGQLAGKAGQLGSVFGRIGTFLTTTPVGNLLLIAGGVAAIGAAIESIPSEADNILQSVQNIQITVDEESVNETLEAIRKVRAEAETLSNPELSAHYENTAAAVTMGFGTNSMYGDALGFEAKAANAEIDSMLSDYGGQLMAIETNIVNAATEAEKAMYLEEYRAVEAERDQALSERQGVYSQMVSDLFSGMAGQMPGVSAALEKASTAYDLLSAMERMNEFDVWNMAIPDNWGDMDASQQMDWEQSWQAQKQALIADVAQMATSFGYLDMSYEEAMGNIGDAVTFEEVWTAVLADMETAVDAVGNNPLLAGFLQSIFSDESVMQNLDPAQFTGALDGIVEAMDFKSAVDQAGGTQDFGQYLTGGLADGITDGGGAVESAAQSVGAMAGAGMAAGIAESTGSAIAAAQALASSVAAIMASVLEVSSPSRVTQAIGNWTGIGFAEGIMDAQTDAEKAAAAVADSVTSVWDDISFFAGLENEQLASGAKNAVKISDSDLRRIREVAEREVVNRFTTATVQVEMHNTNEIRSELDLDGIADYLGDKVTERLEAAAEGVYA